MPGVSTKSVAPARCRRRPRASRSPTCRPGCAAPRARCRGPQVIGIERHRALLGQDHADAAGVDHRDRAEPHQLAGHVAAPAAVLDRGGAQDRALERERRAMAAVAAADARESARRAPGLRRQRAAAPAPTAPRPIARARREQRLRGAPCRRPARRRRRCRRRRPARPAPAARRALRRTASSAGTSAGTNSWRRAQIADARRLGGGLDRARAHRRSRRRRRRAAPRRHRESRPRSRRSADRARPRAHAARHRRAQRALGGRLDLGHGEQRQLAQRLGRPAAAREDLRRGRPPPRGRAPPCRCAGRCRSRSARRRRANSAGDRLAWMSKVATSGTRGPTRRAQAREQRRIGVVLALGDHRAVQRDERRRRAARRRHAPARRSRRASAA